MKLRSIMTAAALVLVPASPASAVRWNNSAGGSFQLGSNWLGGSPPGAADQALFDLAGYTYVVTFAGSPTNNQLIVGRDAVTFDLNGNTYNLTAATASPRSVIVGELGFDNAALTVLDGTLSSVWASVGQVSGSQGVVTVGAAGRWNNSMSVDIGQDGDGSLRIIDGGDFTANSLTLANDFSATAAGEVTGSGSTINLSGTLTLSGFGGVSTFLISGGGDVFANNVIIGSLGIGADARMTVSGTGSTLNATNELDVSMRGDAPGGRMRVEAGADVTSATGFIGKVSDSEGGAVITGAGSTWTMTGDLTVGTGKASLEILNGGLVSNLNGLVTGGSTLRPVSVRVGGNGTRWNNSGALTVQGSTSLTIDGKAVVTSATGSVATGATGSATVLITDQGSTWDISGGFSQASSASTTVANGATLSSAGGTISRGLVAVTGNNSRWTNTGSVLVGTVTATGQMRVEAGGAVSNTNAIIADGVGAQGTVAILGVASMWSINGDLTVGNGAENVGSGGIANLDISAGALVSNNNGFVARVATGRGDVTLIGNGTTWNNTAALAIGGSLTTAGGTGSLTIDDGAAVSVGTDLRLHAGSTVDLLGGTLSVSDHDGFIIDNDDDFQFDSGTLRFRDNTTLGTSLLRTILGTTPRLATAQTLQVDAVATLDGSLIIDGGTLNIGSLVVNGTFNFNNGTLGFIAAGGSMNSPVITNSLNTTININANNVSLGSAASFSGFHHEGVLNVGGNTVTLNSAGYATLGVLTTLAGGTINAPNGVYLSGGGNLVGNGAVNARVASDSGSVIEANGALALGDAASPAGFNFDGELRTRQHAVTLRSSSQASLGNLATLGNAGTPGTLNATNGLVVDFGDAITGYGTVNSTNTLAKRTIINGTARGSFPAQPLTFTGYVKGVGSFDNVNFTGTFDPGLSPAILTVGNLAFAPTSTLVMELGGATPGSQHDQIQSSGTPALAGTLHLPLINGFIPQRGDRFDVMTFAARTGAFDALTGTPPGGGLELRPVYLPDKLVILTTTAGDKTWGVDASGNSSLGANWLGGVAPGGVNDRAAFTTIISASRTVTVDAPLVAGSLYFDDNNDYVLSGASAITLDVTAGAARIDVKNLHGNGAHTIAAPLSLNDHTVIDVAGAAGRLNITGPIGAAPGASLTKAGAGTVVAHQVTLNGALAVDAGTLEIATDGTAAATLRARGITVAGGARLEMNDNDFIVDYTGASPEFTLRDHVKAIVNGGTSGIAFTVGAGDVTIAVAEKTEWGFSTFNGFTLDDTTIVGKYTYFGDANLDGKVTSDDYVAVDVGLGTGNSWVQGDFNFSGTVTSDDYVAIDVNLGKGTPTPLGFAELKAEMIALHTAMFGAEYVEKLVYAETNGFGATFIPEPRAFGFAAIGVVFASRIRRRRLVSRQQPSSRMIPTISAAGSSFRASRRGRLEPGDERPPQRLLVFVLR